MRHLVIAFVIALQIAFGFSAFADTNTNSNSTQKSTGPTDDQAPPALIVRPMKEPPALKSAPTPALQSSDTVSVPRKNTLADWRLSAGPGMAVYGGDLASSTGTGSVGYALNLGALARLSGYDAIWVGADIGFNSWTFASPVSWASVSAVGVQMLATAIYQFGSVITNDLKPFVGISAGPYVYVAQMPAGNQSIVYLEVLVRPGLLYQASSQLAFGFEPKFGLLGSSFVFAPQLSVNLFL